MPTTHRPSKAQLAAWRAELRQARLREARLLRDLQAGTDSATREDAAEALGQVGTCRALPPLVLALRDPDVFVRHDALWAVESICRLHAGALSIWLDLDINHPTQVYRKVSGWWRSNRRYLEGNELLSPLHSRDPIATVSPRRRRATGSSPSARQPKSTRPRRRGAP